MSNEVVECLVEETLFLHDELCGQGLQLEVVSPRDNSAMGVPPPCGNLCSLKLSVLEYARSGIECS